MTREEIAAKWLRKAANYTMQSEWSKDAAWTWWAKEMLRELDSVPKKKARRK